MSDLNQEVAEEVPPENGNPETGEYEDLTRKLAELKQKETQLRDTLDTLRVR